MSTQTTDASPLLVVISGPSGVGKDAVLAEMRRSHPGVFFAVTATTRSMRPGEVDGQDYLFVTPERFDELVQREEFLEHAEVYGRRYGSPKEPVRRALAEGRDVVLKVDVQGAASIRRIAPDALLVFLSAPSMEELERRLTSRKTEAPDVIALRIETARAEMREASWFDRVIVNETDGVAETVERIVELIEQQRSRTPPRRVAI